MKINELQMPQYTPQQINSVKQQLKNLVANVSVLSDTNPAKLLVKKLLNTLSMASNLAEAIAQGSALNTTYQLIDQLFTNPLIQIELGKISELIKVGAPLAEIEAKKEALAKQVHSTEPVKQAVRAHETKIKLDTQGQIGKLDADIEAVAKEFAERFGVKLNWARNLVGMFSIKINREDRVKFLKACLAGKALSIPDMIKRKEGELDDCVTTSPPTIKEVFKSIKDTLLDISLSTGQRGATGPFEAMLAIMGGATKPGVGEGGDLVYNGDKFEVKSCSISISKGTGGASGAWLEAGPAGEVGGSKLRAIARDWLDTNFPEVASNKQLNQIFQDSDFLKGNDKRGIQKLAVLLEYMDSQKSRTSNAFLSAMMLGFFPNVDKAPGFDFANSINAMVTAVKNLDHLGVGKQQGIMALIEYHIGKGNDGFIFFNSSVQRYRIVKGMEGILEIANKPEAFNVYFNPPMSMGSRPKASPGIYYGPTPTSAEGRAYVAKFNSDPERVKLAAQSEQK
jgi:hypothetical protein